ncbi:hypothetical protein [Cryobacterium luteum]|uniref:Uncharacterized protein n=1 Tax=Cryobacterium luteum TaxID=1424661 RepID=A0A1H8JNH0_9MICO|nr:hypothetical protein [Cryobacterium luteum]TFB83895.1 hypothetical protein E3O10_16565 [Cryobacterium luteum]SEN82270.1 hypothetical protein SAMN05216281_11555 [Cryobacterium luteum]
MLAVTAIEARGGIGVLTRLTIFGAMSYSVYLCHVLVLNVIGRAWGFVSTPDLATNPVVAIVFWVGAFGAVVLVGYLSYRLIERPVMGVSKRYRSRVFREKRMLPKM